MVSLELGKITNPSSTGTIHFLIGSNRIHPPQDCDLPKLQRNHNSSVLLILQTNWLVFSNLQIVKITKWFVWKIMQKFDTPGGARCRRNFGESTAIRAVRSNARHHRPTFRPARNATTPSTQITAISAIHSTSGCRSVNGSSSSGAARYTGFVTSGPNATGSG